EKKLALTNRAFTLTCLPFCGKLLGQVIGGKRNEGTISIYQKISLGRDLVGCCDFCRGFRDALAAAFVADYHERHYEK
ncbi:hypothetical protein, partial [Lacticaseibacillus rhamnosus]|uniref:hypothetical protein n=1 Tax=Lacticaseibacillus rhamnosus TaxID=47715 RepID=UPI001CDD7DA8